MKKISKEEYDRLIAVDFENEKLRNENMFLHSKIIQHKIRISDEEMKRASVWDDKKITETDLSVRTMNALRAMDIETVADLIIHCQNKGTTSLLRFRNFGKKSYEEVFEFMITNKILL